MFNLRIAMITSYWKNSDGGGIKTYVVNLVDELKKNNVDVSVLFREGVDCDQYDCGKNKIWFIFKSYRQLNKLRPDVIHSHGTWYCLFPGVVYKTFNKSTLIFTFHSEPKKKLSLPARIFFHRLLDKCDCVTFVSKGLEEQVVDVDEFSFQRTEITYSGVKLFNVTNDNICQFIDAFNLNSSSPVILVQAFTANELKVRGLKIVIRAIKLLRSKFPNIKLLITRDGQYTNELKKFVGEENIRDCIIFTGDVQNPFIPIVLSDIFIFPWLGKSGVGLALLEAMVCGKPVIVTDTGNGSEVIDNGINGLLVPPEPEAIAKKIELLIENPEYSQNLGNNAKTTAEIKFTWKRTAEKFIEIYDLKH